jgi:hypothetical protein
MFACSYVHAQVQYEAVVAGRYVLNVLVNADSQIAQWDRGYTSVAQLVAGLFMHSMYHYSSNITCLCIYAASVSVLHHRATALQHVMIEAVCCSTTRYQNYVFMQSKAKMLTRSAVLLCCWL